MKRWLVIGYVGSFLIFAAFPIFRFDPTLRVLPRMTDHASHWGAALLLATQGFDVYRRPVTELCEPTTAEQRAELAAYNCQLRGHPGVRPFVVNWPQYPRVYPPGAMLLGAPSAALFALRWLDFGQANLLMVLLLVAGAHLASLLLLLLLWRPDRAWQSVVLCLILPLAHLQLVEGALRGIFDPVPIACVLLALWFLRRERPVEALLALAAAEFTHFRALWFLPLLAFIGWQVLRRRKEWAGSRRSLALIAASLALLGLAAFSFLLVLPALRTFHLTNPFAIRAFQQEPGLVLAYGVPLLGIVGVLAWNRSWLTLSVVLWQLLMLLQTREVQQWHTLFLLPIVGLAAEEKERGAATAAVLALFLWEYRVVFSGWPFTGELLTILFGT